ncbi:Chaperone protein DnaJ [Lachnellula suecica]|uniref:Chaperone protein DnaJ n=1 Tax=Lachnellula suecica TaxID=602035 RepID=A0A8T9CQB4_9HELO|nr:Chaperone protein DnaJ [Lachnellula suecica]
MPPTPSLDYYQTLEVEKSADTETITASYRRLARVHHPDKDRENPEATAKFQQIQEAYEHLSDPAKRARHDGRSRGRGPIGSPFNFSSYSSRSAYDTFDFGYNEDDDEDDDSFYHGGFEEMDEAVRDFIRSQFLFNPDFSARPGTGFGHSNHASREEELRKMQEKREAQARYTELRKASLAESQARAEEARIKDEAKAKAKREAEEQELSSRKQREDEERVRQVKMWDNLNAITLAEQQSTCLHTTFWPKEARKRKFKCGCCGQKRGPTAYKCPHCALLSCQGCLSNLIQKLAASTS